MPKPLAIVTADWHLRRGARIWNTREKPAGDAVCAVKHILDLVRQYRTPYLILAGDILDSPKNYSDCVSYLALLGDTLNANPDLKLIYVQGQHDMANPPWLSLLPFADRIWHLNFQAVTDPDTGLIFSGCDYISPASERSLDQLPEGDIIVTHQVCIELIPNGLCTFNALPKCKVLISGDYHKTTYRVLDTLTKVLIPGCIAPNNLIEALYPSFNVFLLYDDLETVETLALPRRPVILLDEASCPLEGLDKDAVLCLNSELPEEIREPIVIVCGSSEYCSGVKGLLDYPYVYVKLRDGSRIDFPRPVNLEKGGSIQELYVEYFREKYPHLVNLVPAFTRLASGCTHDVVEQYVNEALGIINKNGDF